MGTVDTQRTHVDDRSESIDDCRPLAALQSPVYVAGRRNKHQTAAWRCAWAPDSSYVAWSCGYGLVKTVPWNHVKNCPLLVDDTDESGRPLKHDRIVRTFDAGELVFSVAFGAASAPDSQRKSSLTGAEASLRPRYRYKVVNDLILAVGLKGGRIRAWNVRTGKMFLVLMDHTRPVQDLQFAPDHSLRLLSASGDGSLKLWHLDDDGNMSHTFRCKSLMTNMIACAWSPDCRRICGVGNQRGVSVWDMESKESRQFRGHVNDVCACSFSPDGVRLATSSHDTTVIIWRVQSGEQLTKLHHLLPPPREWMVGGSNNHYVRSLSFSPDGLHVSTVCEDGYLRVWNLDDPSVPVQSAKVEEPLSCSFSNNSAAIAVGNREGTLSFWAAPSRRVDLQHMCRQAFQKAVTRNGLTDSEQEAVLLAIPAPLRVFINYDNLQNV